MRNAIATADSSLTPTAITFDPKVFATAKTITLNGNPLDLSNISQATTLTGPTAGVTLSGNNQSGGIIIFNGVNASFSNLTVTNCTSRAILNSGTITLSNVILTSNTGGGLDTSGVATLTNVTVSNNSSNITYGAGIYNTGTLNMTDATVSGNALNGFGGGGLANNGTAMLANVTIANNSATGYGGGIYNPGLLHMNSVTVAGNSGKDFGGGLFNYYGGTAVVADSIIAGNTLSGLNVGPDAYGTIAAQAPNLVGIADGATGWLYNDLTGTTAHPLNAMLEPLGNYGGPTQTMPPLPGSPAIEAGTLKWILPTQKTDQRGLPRTANGAVDIGAVELATFVVNTTDDTLDSPVLASHMTFRDAVSLADQTSVPTTITFDNKAFGSPQALILNGASLDLSQNTALIGPSGGITINGNAQSNGIIVNGRASISSLIITNNSNRGITNHGTLFLTNVALTNNTGGGLDNSGTATATDVTVSGNSLNGYGGGGIYSTGTLTFINSTIANNSSTGYGGGILNYGGTLYLYACTIAGNAGTNYGGGIFNYFGGVATLADSIVAANTITGSSVGPDAYGAYISNGYNLIGKDDSATGWVGTDLKGTIAAPLNAGLSALSNNGGLTPTLSPAANSPAIMAGSPSLLPPGIITDQRGAARVVNGAMDIGAVESEVFLVNSTNDTLDASIQPSHMTLRDAVALANAATVPSAINFDPNVFSTPSTITLTQGQLELSNTYASVTVTGPNAAVTISGNNTSGGLKIDHGVTAIVSAVAISKSSGLGIDNYGILTLTGASLIANLGGGLNNHASQIASTLLDDTISGNSCSGSGGAGIHNTGILSIINSTIASNITTGSGGGIVNNAGSVSLADCTIAYNTGGNSGGGIGNFFGGTVTLSNTLIADNSLSTTAAGPDVAGSFSSNGFNLIGKTDGSSGWVASDLTGTIASPLNPLLSLLTPNGGRTLTIKPLSGSPAITADRRPSSPQASAPINAASPASSTVTWISAQFETQIRFNASISGTIYNDLNGNGSLDNGEPGLAHWLVFLDLNNDGKDDPGDPSTFTDSNGNYQFNKLAPGSYRVTEVQPSGAGYVLTPASGYVDVTVSGGQVLTGLNFGVQKIANATLGGKVYDDLNGNKVFDSGDTTLSGWTVYLDLNNDGAFNNNEPYAVTDSQGNYTFTGLAAGTYTVREIIPSTSTLLAEQPASGSLQVTVAAGGVVMNQNFANHPPSNTPGGIGGFVFNDSNANGKLDSTETGLPNRFVFLDSNGNGVWDLGEPATFTDSSGHYLFSGLPAGTYQVRATLPPGSTQTTPPTQGKVYLSPGQNADRYRPIDRHRVNHRYGFR